MEANWHRHYFSIADHRVGVFFREGQTNDLALIPSYEPFRTTEEEDCVMVMEVDDTLHPVPKVQRSRIRVFDTGNGDTAVDRLEDGGYQFIIKDIRGRACCLLIADKAFAHCRCALNGDGMMRSFGLNSALMLAYAFATGGRQTLLIHASLVRHQGRGYAFVAKSGTGKSTQVAMWLRCIPGCDLMNDDNPVVRVIDGEAMIYGSPWSGKTPCYRQVKAPLGAITQIDRAPANSVDRLSPLQALAILLPSCSSMKWDERLHGQVCDTMSEVIGLTPIYMLHCLPNEEAARVCCRAIAKEWEDADTQRHPHTRDHSVAGRRPHGDTSAQRLLDASVSGGRPRRGATGESGNGEGGEPRTGGGIATPLCVSPYHSHRGRGRDLAW